jgi:hypothetical protein
MLHFSKIISTFFDEVKWPAGVLCFVSRWYELPELQYALEELFTINVEIFLRSGRGFHLFFEKGFSSSKGFLKMRKYFRVESN